MSRKPSFDDSILLQFVKQCHTLDRLATAIGYFLKCNPSRGKMAGLSNSALSARLNQLGIKLKKESRLILPLTSREISYAIKMRQNGATLKEIQARLVYLKGNERVYRLSISTLQRIMATRGVIKGNRSSSDPMDEL